jgi:hypothetical protein
VPPTLLTRADEVIERTMSASGPQRTFTKWSSMSAFGAKRTSALGFSDLATWTAEEVKREAFLCTAHHGACGQPSSLSKVSAYVGDAFLGVCFRRSRCLRRQLKYRCFLTAT